MKKSDLQRKLAIVPTPKPPAGLAERIKTEIPKHLRFNAEEERERLSESVGFNIRVAASILILISCAYLALQVMSRYEQPGSPTPPSAARTVVTQTPALAKAQNEETRSADAAAPAPAKSKLAARRRQKEEKKQEAQPTPSVVAAAPAAPAAAESVSRVGGFAKLTAMRDEAAETEITTSPVSGKVMMRRGDSVVPVEKNLKVIAWKDASPETKTAILKAELAAGGDPKAIAKAAREAGLNEFAESLEKKKQP